MMQAASEDHFHRLNLLAARRVNKVHEVRGVIAVPKNHCRPIQRLDFGASPSRAQLGCPHARHERVSQELPRMGWLRLDAERGRAPRRTLLCRARARKGGDQHITTPSPPPRRNGSPKLLMEALLMLKWCALLTICRRVTELPQIKSHAGGGRWRRRGHSHREHTLVVTVALCEVWFRFRLQTLWFEWV